VRHPARNLWESPPFNAVTQPVGIAGEGPMYGVIYLVGLIVVVMFILSLVGLR
jgi:hypothetical protein